MTWEDLIAKTGRVLGNGTTSLPRWDTPLMAPPALPVSWTAPRLTAVRPCPSEDDEQRNLFDWREAVLPQEPRLDLLYHCPNGKHRSTAAAGQLKALGVKRHIPDLFLAVACDGFHGFYDELKALDGVVPPGQKALHARLRAQGYFVAVSFGWVAAARELCRYLHRRDLAQGLEGAR